MPTHRWGDYTPSGHLGRILDDKTPQLGGMLDGNGFTFNGAVAFEAQAGEALSKGNAVYVSGVSGNKPVVMKADADDAAKMPAFGIAETDASLNANVNVVTFGTVYEIDTSAYSAGDELYVSTTAGALTATKPTGATAKLQNIGKVIRSHASAGSIKVGGAGRTNAVPNLDNGTVFIGDSNNQAEQRALVEADISDFGTYIGLTDLSVTTNTAGTAALSYNNTTGVFSYTPPDLSSYLTSYTETDTLDSVTDRGATTTNDIGTGKITVTNANYDNHLEMVRSSEQWRLSPSTNGSLDIRRVAGTGTARVDIQGHLNTRLNDFVGIGMGETDPSYDLHIRASTPQIFLQPTADTQSNRIHFSTASATGGSSIYGGGVYADEMRFNGGSFSFFGDLDVDGVITADEFNTPIQSATNLAVGWYTIGYLASGRAGARFAVWDTSSGRHQYCVLYASHMYGNNNSNTINILTYAVYSGSPIQKFRLKENGTYDGAALQVYLDDASNSVSASIVGDNVQSPGWTLADWVDDATNPGVSGTWSSFVARAEIDLADVGQGGISATGNVLAGGDVIVDVPSGSSSGFYGPDSDFGFEIGDGGIGGKTVRIKNNGSTIFSHNQVGNVIDLNTDVRINGTLDVVDGSIDLTDEESPSLPVSIVSTGTLGNGGDYSPLKQSGQLQYSATSHLFADNDIVTSGYPGAWFEVDGGFRFGMGSAEKVAINGNGLQIGGAGIGSRANSLSIVGDNNSSTIASKVTAYDTVAAVLPWSSGITYLSSGTYYDDGSWVHASDNAYSALFHLAGTGANWYASSNSSASWNLASNQVLWNSGGQWANDVYLASTKDIILPLNNNDIMFQAANVDITANSGRSGVVRFANTAADTWTGFSSYTGGRDWQYLHRDGDCGLYDNTAGQWKIRYNTGAGIYFYYGATLTTQTTSEGTYTDGIGTFATASGPAIKISDTSGTGATNHNSWLSFRDSGGTEVGYVGYGSSGDSDLSLSNYNNGVVNIQGTKATVITSTGYIDIGSLNTSHAHFYTDRGSYYFNKLTYIDGSGLRGYDSSTDCRFPLYYDLNDTSYYCDPASTSRFNINYSNNHSTVAGAGYGLRFWNSDSYKIYMSAISDSTWGGDVPGSNASDYAMYFRMTSGTNRGFIFRNNTTNVAKIDGNGVYSGSGVFGTGQYLDLKYNASGGGGVRLYDSDSTLQGYWYGNGSGEHGFLDNDGAWAVRIRTGTNQMQLRVDNNPELYVYTSYVRAIGSMRSPIFYDFNNTSYYAHLDSTGDSIRAAGDIVAYYSDERLKNIEGPIENALDKVSTLNGFYYRGNEKAQKLGYDDKLKVGLSAQEVQKVLPEVIKSCPADNQYMTLDYSKVVPLLVEAIKELKSEIEELKK